MIKTKTGVYGVNLRDVQYASNTESISLIKNGFTRFLFIKFIHQNTSYDSIHFDVTEEEADAFMAALDDCDIWN
jgi:hypothetical protein